MKYKIYTLKKGVYLASRQHRLDGLTIDYNDIVNYPGINLCCDMLSVDLTKYDYIIATPPCNYYTRANYRRETSKVAQETKHLLPDILKKLENVKVPFIVENVQNKSLLPKSNFYEFDFGGHHFYTNVKMVLPPAYFANVENKQYKTRSKRDNNYNVHLIIKIFLHHIHIINFKYYERH